MKTSSENKSVVTHKQNIICTSHSSTFQNNNQSNVKVDNKPIEEHSKAINSICNTNNLIGGLGEMSILFNKKGNEGIITKCSHSFQKNVEQQKPNCLSLQNSKNISCETVFGSGDLGLIKTLRKGGLIN